MNVYQIPMRTFASNCYVIESDKKNCAVIDPGHESDRILDALREHGDTPVMILLTHGHFDHIGAVAALAEAFGCPVWMSREDAPMASDGEKSGGIHYHRRVPPFTVTDYLDDGKTISFDDVTIKVIATPGHTAGGRTFLCGEYLFTGDTLFDHDVGRTDLYGGSYEALQGSLKTLAALPGDYRLMPGHNGEGTLGAQRAMIARIAAGMD